MMFCKNDMHGGVCFIRLLLMIGLVLLLYAFLGDVSEMTSTLIVIFVTASCAVTVVTPVVIHWAKKLGALDMPGGRHWHTEPTPRLGGIAIWVGVVVALLLTSIHYMPNLKALMICSTLMLFVGVLDDIYGVSAGVRLFMQVTACIILLLDGIHVTFLPPTWWGIGGEWIITIVWIVGITNAINFLDGIDGLVAGMAAGTSVMYFVLAHLLDSPMMAYLSVVLFGACIAFLGFNMRPARIFLGDGGSSFLGFFLATMSIQGEWAKNEPLVSFFIPILLLSVPIYDMVFTTVSRIASGKVYSLRTWIDYTGKDHLHHRLNQLGLTKTQVTICICFLNLAVGFGAITLLQARTYGGVALILQAVCIYLMIALLETLGLRSQQKIKQKTG